MRTTIPRCGLAALVLAVAIPVFAAGQTFERSLQVTGPVTLSASTGSGDIVVRLGTDAWSRWSGPSGRAPPGGATGRPTPRLPCVP